jgi:peptidyl-prolyl cis-trans isomerase B (cyclophilin B)
MAARLLAVLIALLCSSVLVSCGDDEATGSDDSSGGTGITCQYPEDGSQPAREVEPPPEEATATGEVDATIATSAGDIGVTLDADAAPCTVNSFLSLADQGYFDDTPCHRLTTAGAGIFVLQCGDPTGVGSGGPGYTFPDELTGDESYPAGTLAMANQGPDTDTNGSQFFMVYDDTPLPPAYTVFGKIDEAGLDVLGDVAAKGTANGAPDGPPKENVQMESVTVS